MDRFSETETVVLALLLAVSLVAVVVRRLRIPYTVALVGAGLLITSERPSALELTPELILGRFIPPLVFEAAFHLNWADLRRTLPAVLLPAGPGVVASTLAVGGVLGLATPLSLSTALVFGALIAATDPVSVVAVFPALGVPRRLATLVEGRACSTTAPRSSSSASRSAPPRLAPSTSSRASLRSSGWLSAASRSATPSAG